MRGQRSIEASRRRDARDAWTKREDARGYCVPPVERRVLPVCIAWVNRSFDREAQGVRGLDVLEGAFHRGQDDDSWMSGRNVLSQGGDRILLST